MSPFDVNFIDQLSTADTAKLAALDAAGLLICNGEDLDDFKTRVKKIGNKHAEIEQTLAETGELTLLDEFKFTGADRIPPEIMDEAAAITEHLYKFSIKWVPGFFLSQNLGILWGGCAITDPDEYFTVFLIRKNFTKRPKWFIYRRDELLSHELCHAARMVFDDLNYEEHFAYRTAHSKLRRYIGNCFQTKYDALLFLLPVLVLLVAEIIRTFTRLQYPIYPFWILALAYPFFLLLRNHFQRRTYFQALIALTAAGCTCPRAVLFRCVTEEIKKIASFRKTPEQLQQWLEQKIESSLKWHVIKYRFFDGKEVPDTFNNNHLEGE